MTRDSVRSDDLLQRAARGDQEGWGELLMRHRDRLHRMLSLRLDRRLQGRIDPSDVLQEVYLEASARLAEYLREPVVPFFLWLRLLAGQRMLALRRHHFGAQKRAASREVSLYQEPMPEASSAVLAAQLVGDDTRPSEAAVRAELRTCVQEALDAMEPLDREMLALRHYEQLSTAEAAQVLGIKVGTASKRYFRALKRLKDHLANTPGQLGGILG